MSHLLPVLRCAVPSLYVLSVVLYGMRFFGRGEPYARFARPAFLAALAAHFAFLTTFILVHRRIPLATAPEILTVIAFSTAVAYAYVETRTRNQMTGLFLVGFSMLLQFASSGRIALEGEVKPLLRVPLFGLHTLSAILGYSAFAVSAIYGFLFLLLYHELKSSHFGLIYRRLPPLEVLAKMNIRAAAFGFAALTIAIPVGIRWASQLYPGFMTDPMFLTTGFVWVIYAVCLAAHYFLGWRGHRTVYLSIGGFILMGIALVALNMLLHSFHRFAGLGWISSSLV
jgi:ABC-type uncharacterized transport system permease subunit